MAAPITKEDVYKALNLLPPEEYREPIIDRIKEDIFTLIDDIISLKKDDFPSYISSVLIDGRRTGLTTNLIVKGLWLEWSGKEVTFISTSFQQKDALMSTWNYYRKFMIERYGYPPYNSKVSFFSKSQHYSILFNRGTTYLEDKDK